MYNGRGRGGRAGRGVGNGRQQEEVRPREERDNMYNMLRQVDGDGNLKENNNEVEEGEIVVDKDQGQATTTADENLNMVENEKQLVPIEENDDEALGDTKEEQEGGTNMDPKETVPETQESESNNNHRDFIVAPVEMEYNSCVANMRH